MIFTNSIETRPNEIKASRKSRSKNFQKFVFFPTHGRRKKFYLRGGVLKPLKKWLLSMIRMETDTTPLYHRIQLGCQDTRTLITLQTFDGAHSNGEVGRIERRQAHGGNRKRKGFLIGGVRLQWRRASGLEGRPWYRSFATGVQSIVALKAAWKNKLKAANTARGIGIIIKQLLASIQPGQWMSLGKLCDNPMAYIDHRAIPIQPRGGLFLKAWNKEA